jgi:hypothetical protein
MFSRPISFIKFRISRDCFRAKFIEYSSEKQLSGNTTAYFFEIQTTGSPENWTNAPEYDFPSVIICIGIHLNSTISGRIVVERDRLIVS